MTVFSEYSRKYDFFYMRSIKLYNNIPEPFKNVLINQQYITWQALCKIKKRSLTITTLFTCFISLVGNGEQCHSPLFIYMVYLPKKEDNGKCTRHCLLLDFSSRFFQLSFYMQRLIQQLTQRPLKQLLLNFLTMFLRHSSAVRSIIFFSWFLYKKTPLLP